MSNRNGREKEEQAPGNRITIRPAVASRSDKTSEDAVDAANGELAPKISLLANQIERLSRDMNRAQLRDYVELTHKPWLLIWRSFISGLSRGIGIALGFTFFAATIVWILTVLGQLNLPIVGDYIADIVRIVNRQLEINPY